MENAKAESLPTMDRRVGAILGCPNSGRAKEKNPAADGTEGKACSLVLPPQWAGQLLLLPGGLTVEVPGPRRAHHHLHHPPAQRQTL